MTLTAPQLIRSSGLAALAAGLIYAGIQPLHPPDVVASVTTGTWAVLTPLKTAMCVLMLAGLAGLYARQLRETGWLGLTGFVLFTLGWLLLLAFIFAEAFIMPPLVAVAPAFVDGYLGVAAGRSSPLNLGAVPGLFAAAGVLYTLGGLLFGIATFRAGLLPRGAAALLAVAAVLTPLAALTPHAVQRLAGMPVGLALAWLGYALWTERRAPATATSPGRAGPQLTPTK